MSKGYIQHEEKIIPRDLLEKNWENAKNFGKVREFCRFEKMRTPLLYNAYFVKCYTTLLHCENQVILIIIVVHMVH